MKKLLLTGIAGLFLISQANAQMADFALDWTYGFGDWAGDEGRCLAIGANDVYTAGTFRGTINLDQSGTATPFTSSGGGTGQDMYIASHTQITGAFNWSNQITTPSSGNAVPSDIIADGSGDVYVTGSFTGMIDFNPSTSAAYNLTSIGMTDIFIAKYNGLTGALIWVKRIGNTLSDYADAITLDASSRVLITGYFSGTVDFNPDPMGFANKTSLGGTDIFLARYTTAAGAYSLGVTWGSTADDGGTGICVDASANVVVCGYFGGACDFNPSSSGATVVTPLVSGQDIFLAKYSSTFVFGWVNGLLTTSGPTGLGDRPDDVVTDASGNIYMTGGFAAGTVAFDPGSAAGNKTNAGTGSDIFIAKYGPGGAYQWVQQTGGTSHDAGRAIAIDASNYIYVVGCYTGGGIDFNPGTGTDPVTGLPQVDVFTGYGSTDHFIVRYHISGMYRNGHGTGGALQDDCVGIAATNYSRDIYVTGFFSDLLVDFDPDPFGSTTLSTSTGGTGDKDIFIARYNWNVLPLRQIGPGALVMSSSLNVYPNPANDALFIDNLQQGTMAEIYSPDGKLVHSSTMEADGTMKLDLSAFGNGVYLLHITKPGGETVTEKVVVQH